MDGNQCYMAQQHHSQYKSPTGHHQQDPAYDAGRKNQQRYHPQYKLPPGQHQQDPVYDTWRKNQRRYPLDKLLDLAYDMEKNTQKQQRHHPHQKLSTYYQTMHISEIEYMMNDPRMDH